MRPYLFDKDARIFVASKNLDQITPRWEWRTFSASLAALERAIGPLADVAPRNSSEIYILSLHGPQNAKLRGGLIDIKRLQQVDDDGLELWEPVFKAKLPLDRSDIAVAFSEWHLPLPALGRDSYTIEFFNSLIAAQPALRVARIDKSRRGFVFQGCIAEFVRLSVESRSLQSFSLEHQDRSLILAALE
jgi:exopolyphosphatase / guanosine-5'-triphosphate,3'-diphosphate pyrophosphatase